MTSKEGIFWIDPSIFRDIEKFKEDVDTFIQELKDLPKMDGVEEIYYPGEKSSKARELNIKNGFLEVDEEIFSKLEKLME